MSDMIDRHETKLIPYEEYRLVFDHVTYTEDGATVRIGFPLQCKMCVLNSDKQLIALEIEKLFEKMREAVMLEVQDE